MGSKEDDEKTAWPFGPIYEPLRWEDWGMGEADRLGWVGGRSIVSLVAPPIAVVSPSFSTSSCANIFSNLLVWFPWVWCLKSNTSHLVSLHYGRAGTDVALTLNTLRLSNGKSLKTRWTITLEYLRSIFGVSPERMLPRPKNDGLHRCKLVLCESHTRLW